MKLCFHSSYKEKIFTRFDDFSDRMPNCKVKGCATGGGRYAGPKYTMHGFPKDEVVASQWKRILGMPESIVEAKSHFRGVCSKHFEEDDFIPDEENVDSRGRPRSQRRLRPQAIPTLFLTRMSNRTSQRAIKNEEFIEKKVDKKTGAIVQFWKNTSCCIVNCPAPEVPLNYIEYYCVIRPQREQTDAWLATINKINGTEWTDMDCLNKRICGAHFLSGKPSQDRSNPDWCPSVFKVLLRESNSNTESDQILMNVNVKCEPDLPDPLSDENTFNEDQEEFDEPVSPPSFPVHIKQENPSSEDESEALNLLQCNEAMSEKGDEVLVHPSLPDVNARLESDPLSEESIQTTDPLADGSLQTYMSQKNTWNPSMPMPPNPIPTTRVYNNQAQKSMKIRKYQKSGKYVKKPKPLPEESFQKTSTIQILTQKDALTPSEKEQLIKILPTVLSTAPSTPSAPNPYQKVYTNSRCSKPLKRSNSPLTKSEPDKKQKLQKVVVDAECQTDPDLVGKPNFNFCSGFIEVRSVQSLKGSIVFEAWTQIDTKLEDKATEIFHEKTANKSSAITVQVLEDDKKCRAMCGISLDLLNHTRSILKDKFLTHRQSLTPDDQLVLYLAKDNCKLSEQNIATMFEVYFTTVRKVCNHVFKIHSENIDQLEHLPLPTIQED